jgi:hypothetical protein
VNEITTGAPASRAARTFSTASGTFVIVSSEIRSAAVVARYAAGGHDRRGAFSRVIISRGS